MDVAVAFGAATFDGGALTAGIVAAGVCSLDGEALDALDFALGALCLRQFRRRRRMPAARAAVPGRCDQCSRLRRQAILLSRFPSTELAGAFAATTLPAGLGERFRRGLVERLGLCDSTQWRRRVSRCFQSLGVWLSCLPTGRFDGLPALAADFACVLLVAMALASPYSTVFCRVGAIMEISQATRFCFSICAALGKQKQRRATVGYGTGWIMTHASASLRQSPMGPAATLLVLTQVLAACIDTDHPGRMPQLGGVRTEVGEPKPFVRDTRANAPRDFIPVGVTPPARRIAPRDKQGAAALEKI